MSGEFDQIIFNKALVEWSRSINTNHLICLDQFLDELKEETICYGLPFGAFGIACWFISIAVIISTYYNRPLFSPWNWKKPYRGQMLFAIPFMAILTVGPIIFTVIKCYRSWIMVFITLGQLTPWSFKIMNDGLRQKQTGTRGSILNWFLASYGFFMTIHLSLIGWVGLTMLSIKLKDTTSAVSTWIWAIYVVIMIIIILLWRKGLSFKKLFVDQQYEDEEVVGLCFRVIMMHIVFTLHIVGSHIILAIVFGRWDMFFTKKSGLASAIIFIIGLFIEIPEIGVCNK